MFKFSAVSQIWKKYIQKLNDWDLPLICLYNHWQTTPNFLNLLSIIAYFDHLYTYLARIITLFVYSITAIWLSYAWNHT